MIVFRIESDKDGIGPYRSDNRSFRYWVYDHKESLGFKVEDDMKTHPLPENDVMDWKYNYHFIFGFASLSDLRKWFFPECIDKFEFFEFSVVMYDVPDTAVLHGSSQVTFDKRAARRMGSFKPG